VGKVLQPSDERGKEGRGGMVYAFGREGGRKGDLGEEDW